MGGLAGCIYMPHSYITVRNLPLSKSSHKLVGSCTTETILLQRQFFYILSTKTKRFFITSEIKRGNNPIMYRVWLFGLTFFLTMASLFVHHCYYTHIHTYNSVNASKVEMVICKVSRLLLSRLSQMMRPFLLLHRG